MLRKIGLTLKRSISMQKSRQLRGRPTSQHEKGFFFLKKKIYLLRLLIQVEESEKL